MRFFILLPLAIFLSSCGEDLVSRTEPDIYHKWILDQIKSHESKVILTNTDREYQFIVFERPDKVFVNAGCNYGEGTFSLENGLSVSCPTTMMLCRSEAVMGREEIFTGNLFFAEDYCIQDSRLTIQTTDVYDLIFGLAD